MSATKTTWTPVEAETPVDGENCIIWLAKGMECPGLGDTEEGHLHTMSGIFFSSAEALRDMAPLTECQIPGSFFLTLPSGMSVPIQDVECWRPMVPQPGIEIPSTCIRCLGCGGMMRPSPAETVKGVRKVEFNCPACHRRIRNTMLIIDPGNGGKGRRTPR